jgi:hypothetical protein
MVRTKHRAPVTRAKCKVPFICKFNRAIVRDTGRFQSFWMDAHLTGKTYPATSRAWNAGGSSVRKTTKAPSEGSNHTQVERQKGLSGHP